MVLPWMKKVCSCFAEEGSTALRRIQPGAECDPLRLLVPRPAEMAGSHAGGRYGKTSKAAVGFQYCNKLFAEERNCAAYKPKYRQEYRQSREVPLLEEYYAWLNTVHPENGSKLEEAVRYSLNQKQHLMAYLEHEEVSISNNLAENAIRPFTLGRKNWLFCDTPKGAEASAIVYSLVESAKANGIEPFAYPQHVLVELPYLGKNHSHEELESLMLWAPYIQENFWRRKRGILMDQSNVQKKEPIQLSPFRIITVKHLIRAIREGHKNGERFCFVLSAGASAASEIPSGQSMAYGWLEDIMAARELPGLKEQADKLYECKKLKHTFEQLQDVWDHVRSNHRKTIDCQYYFDIYTLRFSPNIRNGYFALERAMEGKMPSIVFHPLVKLLADPNNGSNLVVTTNFDILVDDALSLFTDAKPLVINHEHLASFARDPNIKRPIVAKIHRGLFFDPLNESSDMGGLKGNWDSVLSQIFNCYTPIVIGYGGGDDTPMKFLRQKGLFLRNGICWCYYSPKESPKSLSYEILEIVDDQNGYLVDTKGFDTTLGTSGKRLGYPADPDHVKKHWTRQQRSRLKRYRDQQNLIQEDDSWKINTPEPEVTTKPKTAWDFCRLGEEFRQRKDYGSAVEAYNQAIALDDTVAVFLRGVAYYSLTKYREAGEDFSKAIELNPNNADAYINRGGVYYKLKQYQQAIEQATKSIALDGTDPEAFENRAVAYRATGQIALVKADEATARKLRSGQEGDELP